MQREYPNDFKKRGKLSELFMERNMPIDMILKIVQPMKGKSQEEVVNKMKKELSDDESEENNDGNVEGEVPEPKVETGMIQKALHPE